MDSEFDAPSRLLSRGVETDLSMHDMLFELEPLVIEAVNDEEMMA